MANPTQTIRGPGGKVIGYVQHLSGDDYQVLNENQKLVAREVQGSTYDANGKFIGKGHLGVMLLNKGNWFFPKVPDCLSKRIFAFYLNAVTYFSMNISNSNNESYKSQHPVIVAKPITEQIRKDKLFVGKVKPMKSKWVSDLNLGQWWASSTNKSWHFIKFASVWGLCYTKIW